MELFCFFDDPADVGNLISGSSGFCKYSLNIWKFTVHILLNHALEKFEHNSASMLDECNCVVVRATLALPFFGTGMKTDLFQSCSHCWVFQTCWHIECSTFTASSFRIWNSSTGIPSPTLALFVVILPKAHLTSHFRMPGSRWVITPSWLSGSWRSSLYSSVYFWNSHKDHHSSPKSRGRDTSDTHCWDQGPETLCCSAYTWTNVSSSDKIQTIRD